MNLKKELPKLIFLLPSAAGTLLFFLLPLCYCMVFACSSTSGRFTFAGGNNYIALFESETFRRALGNTYLMLFLSVGILVLIAMLLLYFLDAGKRNQRGSGQTDARQRRYRQKRPRCSSHHRRRT